VNKELVVWPVVWPPACPKCCANNTALRYDGILDRIACTCGRCKYGWRVPPRDMPEPAAIPSAAEGDGDNEYSALNVSDEEASREATSELDRWRRIAAGRRGVALGWQQRALKAESDCAALRAERDDWQERWKAAWQDQPAIAGLKSEIKLLNAAHAAAIAERDALREKVNRGLTATVVERSWTYNGSLWFRLDGSFAYHDQFPLSPKTRVRVLLEGE
jgi:hypothetical protein